MNCRYTVPMSTRDVGNVGESVACVFLERKGFRVIARNYRKPWGEVDIIAEKGGTVRFVEVKSVHRDVLPDISHETGGYRPEEQVHPKKLAKIARVAETYMAERRDDREYQIDVVGVFLNEKTRSARCRLYENAL